jgi:hypothetical protein
MIYTHAAAAAVALVLGFGAGWKTQGWRWEAAEAERLRTNATELHRATERAGAAAGTFETKRSANEIQYRTVTRTIEKIIDRPVYLQQCFDDDGLRNLNEQISAGTNSGESSAAMPRP